MVKIPTVKCKRCGHEWTPRTENPRYCRKCWSRNWNSSKEKK